MSKVEYEKFKDSLDRLKEQYEFLHTHAQTLDNQSREAFRDSVIKRFEICYDTLLKHLKKYLDNEQLLTDGAPNSPRKIFRLAHEAYLIDKDALKNFFSYMQTRIDTAHDYSLKKAENSLDNIGRFIEDATDLYEAIITE